MAELNIEDIVTQAQRRVKSISDTDKKAFSNHLNTEFNWIEEWLESPLDIRPVAPPLPTELAIAKQKLTRRITDGDFRDRFSDIPPTEVKFQRTDCSTKILNSALETYIRCLGLVK